MSDNDAKTSSDNGAHDGWRRDAAVAVGLLGWIAVCAPLIRPDAPGGLSHVQWQVAQAGAGLLLVVGAFCQEVLYRAWADTPPRGQLARLRTVLQAVMPNPRQPQFMGTFVIFVSLLGVPGQVTPWLPFGTALVVANIMIDLAERKVSEVVRRRRGTS